MRPLRAIAAALATTGLCALCGLLAGAALAAPPEVRRVESVGVVPIDPDQRGAGAPREAALERAVAAAVERMALELLPEDRQAWGDVASQDPGAEPFPDGGVEDPEPMPPPGGEDPDAEEEIDPALAAALGDDPFEYTTRFRILEDQGIRPALFATDPEVENEYVVLVEVHLDVDRLVERLEQAGLLIPAAGHVAGLPLRVVMEGVGSFQAYERVRNTLLVEVGAHSAVPVELERGRVVLQVDAGREPEVLLDDLLREAPPELRIIPLEVDAEGLILLVDLVALPPPASADDGGEAEGLASDAQAIDTSGRNRY